MKLFLSLLILFVSACSACNVKKQQLSLSEHQVKKTWNQHTYVAYRGPKINQPQAEQACRDLGMELVRIDSAEENDFLLEFALNEGTRDQSCATPCTHHCKKNPCDQKQIWFGANDKVQEGRWTWRIGGDNFFNGERCDHRPVNNAFVKWGQAGKGCKESQPNNEPNNETAHQWEDCAVLRRNGKWFDLGCENRRAWYVCESL